MDHLIFDFHIEMLIDDQEDLVELLSTNNKKWNWLIKILNDQLAKQINNES